VNRDRCCWRVGLGRLETTSSPPSDLGFQRVKAAGRDAEHGRRLLLRRVHRWESPGESLQPIVEVAADLICNQDFRLIRSCEGSACVGVPRPHDGSHPALVQHGGLRQPHQGGGAPGQKGRGMKKGGRDTRHQSVAMRASGRIARSIGDPPSARRCRRTNVRNALPANSNTGRSQDFRVKNGWRLMRPSVLIPNTDQRSDGRRLN
jgi:hypothetical protein